MQVCTPLPWKQLMAGHGQQGMATLFMTLIALVGITLVVIFASKTTVLEQKIAANSVRAAQAAAAAQAGLEAALAHLQGGGLATTCEFLYKPASGTAYWARFHHPDTIVPLCGTEPPTSMALTATDCTNMTNGGSTTPVRVLSCGWSDDRTARKYALTDVKAGPSMAGDGPPNPLMSGDGVLFSGGAKVFNFFSNLTVWTADELGVNGNPGNTYIRNPDCPITGLTDAQIRDILTLTTTSCGAGGDYFIRTTDKTIIGPDVVYGSTALEGLTDDQFFERTFGVTKTFYKENVVSSEWDIPAASINTAIGARGVVVWVTGNATIPDDIGSPTAPVILVVDGNATITGSIKFHGVLYVEGTLEFQGNAEIYGSAVATNKAFGNGSPRLVYDIKGLEAAKSLGARTALPGMWRDWL